MVQTGRRPRRVDPDRKGRILTAALEVIAEHGVAGTTHRLVAARADVPLGSVTYHFTSLDDLLTQAFARYTQEQMRLFDGFFEQVESREQLVEALVELVHDGAGQRDAVVGFELYLAALRAPALRTVTEEWTSASRAVLARFVGAEIAGSLDALLEGMIIQVLLSRVAPDRELTRAAVLRGLGPAPLKGMRSR